MKQATLQKIRIESVQINALKVFMLIQTPFNAQLNVLEASIQTQLLQHVYRVVQLDMIQIQLIFNAKVFVF